MAETSHVDHDHSVIYRVLPTLACLVVAGASFALSYVALRDVAADIDAVPRHLAFLVPVVIDGGVICASTVIWANARTGARRQVFPFFVVAALVGVSVLVNTAHAGPSILAKVIASLPPLVLLATLELVAGQHRRRAHRSESPELVFGHHDPSSTLPADAPSPHIAEPEPATLVATSEAASAPPAAAPAAATPVKAAKAPRVTTPRATPAPRKSAPRKATTAKTFRVTAEPPEDADDLDV